MQIQYIVVVVSAVSYKVSHIVNFQDWCMVFLGQRCIPLPMCAYDVIRRTFPANSQSEEFSGIDHWEVD